MAEFFPTVSAFVRFFARVDDHVSVEGSLLVELAAANGAQIWFLTRVRTHVDPQLFFLHKFLETHRTFERFFTRVNPGVGLERVVDVETFSADVAEEWPLPRVFAHVHLERGRVGKLVFTDGTLVRLFSSMSANVDVQSVLLAKFSTTFRAYMCLLGFGCPRLTFCLTFPFFCLS